MAPSSGGISLENWSSRKFSRMLCCGHTAPITDLDICLPAIFQGGKEALHSSTDLSMNFSSLISACTDSFLCIWSRSSGHCRRRRRLPLWVGIPYKISSLPKSRRYVCIACERIANNHIPETSSFESSEFDSASHSQSETIVDQESPHRKMSKCILILIVDTCTLSIVQTVFNGDPFISSLNFMAIIPSVEETKKQLLVLADSFGRVCSFMIPEKHSDINENHIWEKSQPKEIYLGIDNFMESVHSISFARDGTMVALVCATLCIFKSVTHGTTISEISLQDFSSSSGDSCTQSSLVGGIFISNVSNDTVSISDNPTEELLKHFVLFNNKGSALVYAVSSSNNTHNFILLRRIPSLSYSFDTEISITFCQLNCFLFRIASVCFDVENAILFNPSVTAWLLFDPLFEEECKSSGDPFLSIMLGEGSLDDWIGNENVISQPETIDLVKSLQESDQGHHGHLTLYLTAGDQGTVNARGDQRVGFNNHRCIVSSSLVLPKEFYAPYAVVNGFYSGEIKVVKFAMFCVELSHTNVDLHEDFDQWAREQSFLGHTGAVLFLAAHRMEVTSNNNQSRYVLISGSMDSTIRIWDLETGFLISVMRHHVAPVRQIILPPLWTAPPWNNCFLSIADDGCVSLVSLESLRVERMFSAHLSYPEKVVWDSRRGYIACLCSNSSLVPNALYIWDVKSGSQERVLYGASSSSMFDYFCEEINGYSVSGNVFGGISSGSSLLQPLADNTNVSQCHTTDLIKKNSEVHREDKKAGNGVVRKLSQEVLHECKRHPIKSSCPFPGVATLTFDLSLLMALDQSHSHCLPNSTFQENSRVSSEVVKESLHPNVRNNIDASRSQVESLKEQYEWMKSRDGCLIRFSLSVLHLWGVDSELDKLLKEELGVSQPKRLIVTSGLEGDRGSLTLIFPCWEAELGLWRFSSEFCAMRSLTMVSLAQYIVSLSHSSSAACSALAAFYTRNFAETVPDIKPPMLQLLISFWQDPSTHVRMAARSLFHCAAARSIPLPLSCHNSAEFCSNHANDVRGYELFNTHDAFTMSIEDTGTVINTWLEESFDVQDWISCVGACSQDARASHIAVAAALAVWYPSLVYPILAKIVVHHLVKLVMAMNDKYSSTAAELLSEGMDSTWIMYIDHEISHLIGDIFFQIECVSGVSADKPMENPESSATTRETLVGILLPSLAMADVGGFLNVIDGQIWATSSDSPIHSVSLMTIIRVVRGCPRSLAPYIDKVVNFILQTMDPGNPAMRKTCLHISMMALKEIVRVFPMVALNDTNTRLAVGDAIGDFDNVTIRVYDLPSVTKLKILDASAPPGFPGLLSRASDSVITTAISALSFSPCGEGLVAFSECGLMIRWWSLGIAWWEKLNRSTITVQCTKLIFVPPWEGFSPSSSRSSIMTSITGKEGQMDFQDKPKGSSDSDNIKLLTRNLDLSYRLEWITEKKVTLTQHHRELGSFQL